LEGAGYQATSNSKITIGNGSGDVVNNNSSGSNDAITLGNGNGDVVNDFNGNYPFPRNNTIVVGNGNDTIDVGNSDTITVGKGHDSLVFEQTTADSIGAVTINGFNPGLDAFTFSSLFAASLSYHDNTQGNAVITVDSAGDTVTLVGVHSSALHSSDFRFV